MITLETLLYRPEWTCGRYNAEHHAAIYYNNIAGMSYFLDGDSADVLAPIVALKHNDKIEVQALVNATGIDIDSIGPFIQQLEQLGLVSTIPITKEIIADYRKRQSEWRRHETQTEVRSVKDKLPMDVSNAEMAYAEAVGGITNVMFELTYNCSEKCIHCYNPGATRNDEEKSGRANRKELELEDYKRIIDELYDEGLTKVCLSGGDPFSKPIVWDIIDYLYNKDIAFDVFTNGQRLIGNEKRLADYFPRIVGVSIYSGDAAEHDYITRIKGSWEKSMHVVKELAALAVPMNMKCCVMRPNIKHYYQVADIAKQYGAVPQFEVSVSDSVEGDRCVSNYLRLTPEQLEIVLRDSNVPLYVGKEAPNFGGQPKDMNVNACGTAKSGFCISPEGNLNPCCSFHAPFGNLQEQSVQEIVHDNDKLNWWRGLTLNDYEECGKYDYCGYCNLCPGHNHSEHGTPLKAAENNCYLAKVRHNLAHKMMKGYDPLNGKSIKETLESLPDYKGIAISRKYSQNNCDKSLTVGG